MLVNLSRSSDLIVLLQCVVCEYCALRFLLGDGRGWSGDGEEEGRDRGDGTGVVGRGGPSPVKRPRLRSVANGSTYMCRKRIDVTSGWTDWKKTM